MSNEAGDVRVAADGTFEYLASQSITLRQGYVEVWEPAATHAAKNMRMPIPFWQKLAQAGYKGGTSLHDLLIAEGWRPPERSYIELTAAEVDEEGIVEIEVGDEPVDLEAHGFRFVDPPLYERDKP